MNVNPFSYLIEKLKGKVDKSGDTMTGTLNIEATNDTPLTLKRTNSSSSVMMNFYNQNGIVGGYVAGNDGKPYYRKSDGTYPQIALTSDISTVSDGSYTASSSYPLDGSATIKVNNKVVTFNAVLATLTADASGAFVQVGTVSPSPVANTYFPVFNGQDTTPLGYGYIASTGKVYMHKNYLKSGKMPVAMATYIAQ